jgi:sigma-B regulation protein RsbU (phosphoserine phosphatase)
LVVDDQCDVREALRLLLKSAGYVAQMADSPDSAIAAALSSDPDLIVIDMNYAFDTTSGQEGLALLDRLQSLKRGVPIIAMTGWSTIDLAVQAMQHGACDFITKPWDVDHLLQMFSKHIKTHAEKLESSSGREKELALARHVQRKLLPPPQFTTGDLEFDCACLPAGEVGGDLYDFFVVDSSRTAFLLGDVSGKGIGAALLVSTLQAMIRGERESAGTPSEMLHRVNRLFYESTRPEHFATLFFGVYDSESRSVRYVNCGHPSAVLLHLDGTHQLLEPSGMMLGAFETCGFEEEQVPFRAGDRLVLFSDGLSESKVSAVSGYEDWVLQKIRLLLRAQPNSLAARLAAAAVSAEPQLDDITVIHVQSRAA